MAKRRTDNTMAKWRTDNTMAKRRRTDNTMAKRRTDNTMAKRNKTNNGHKTLHRELKIDQHESIKTGTNSGATEG